MSLTTTLNSVKGLIKLNKINARSPIQEEKSSLLPSQIDSNYGFIGHKEREKIESFKEEIRIKIEEKIKSLAKESGLLFCFHKCRIQYTSHKLEYLLEKLGPLTTLGEIKKLILDTKNDQRLIKDINSHIESLLATIYNDAIKLDLQTLRPLTTLTKSLQPEIFKYLNFLEQKYLMHVDKSFLFSAKEARRLQKKLTINYDANVQKSLYGYIKTLGECTSRLEYLEINSCSVDDKDLEFISQIFPYLQTLLLNNTQNISKKGVDHLTTLTCLSSINLIYSEFIFMRRGHIAPLKKLFPLTHLRLGGCFEITNEVLAHLAQLTQLKSLELTDCEESTDAGLAQLTRMTQLESLKLEMCLKISDEGLAHLAQLPQLKSLELTDLKEITDTGLAHLTRMTQLESLYLVRCKHITATGAALLIEQLTQLKSLFLLHCGINDAEALELTALRPDLKFLAITKPLFAHFD